MKDNQANNIDKKTVNLTTEEFHKLLEENTRIHAMARTRHTKNLADAQNHYLDEITEISVKEDKALQIYREARRVWEEAKADYEQTIRCCKAARNKAGQDLNFLKTEEANQWTAFNNKIQSERHNIFERFRQSGGGNFSTMLASYFTQDGANKTKLK